MDEKKIIKILENLTKAVDSILTRCNLLEDYLDKVMIVNRELEQRVEKLEKENAK